MVRACNQTQENRYEEGGTRRIIPSVVLRVSKYYKSAAKLPAPTLRAAEKDDMELLIVFKIARWPRGHRKYCIALLVPVLL